ncbi:MAG: hypothetical protein JXA54_11535 [Candidatus Heimdallarchaeota archaeon]|nr:hypothetical protein [Candidatus Heimdallarchaeota archaeon]
MNKKLAILIPLGIISLITASAFLVPMIIYGGATVNVIEGNLSFTSSESDLLALSTKSFTPGISNVNINLETTKMSAIKYSAEGIGGRNEISDDNPSGEISLELSIMFVISKNGTVVKEIDIGVMQGEGLHNVSILLGPEEGILEAGTYELSIVISLELHTPFHDLSLEIILGPFSFVFNPEIED